MIVILIIGLIIELIAIPFHLNFLYFGIVQPSIPFICMLWWFIDLGLYNGFTIIMSWSSFHRYLFIFHDQIFLQGKKRFVFHYLPLSILLLYILIFYIIVIIFPPCKNTYDYTLPVCNDYPCYLDNLVLGIWDSVVNGILPIFIICIFSVTILIRVHYQKRRLVNQRNQWRRQRKMMIQLISSSILYLIPNIPLSLLILAHLCGLSESVGVEVERIVTKVHPANSGCPQIKPINDIASDTRYNSMEISQQARRFAETRYAFPPFIIEFNQDIDEKSIIKYILFHYSTNK
ncbi:unnamed protein product [Rotaria sordida]|uniref:G-protein coupled receptors family 1 profile domain-containing protein n=1 Tax=Rotaria sordida TaxID=392033 RepID=A0A814NXE7_9BILA|nr:unnamed protein product [Rotaria sordida]CAF1097117.1 unnamed protein product [Rotaria sordida]